MAKGLDELIDWLVDEVRYYGDGCALSDLFICIRKFQRSDCDDSEDAPQLETRAPLTDADIKLGRVIWPQVVATGQVTVGKNNEWRHITFDQLISLPEENPEGSGAAIKTDSANIPPVVRSSTSRSRFLQLPEVRPRLHVDEDLVWRAITSHGKDLKRLPMMEWKLLVVIAASREEGILQGDAVRATGQDKRSVPRRTDFLALKGYIAKRTTLVRGTKTSKLWLIDLAPELPAPSNPLRGLDVSEELLTRDMEPVPWYNQWVANRTQSGKEEIAYTALAQTIVAIIRAWGTVRTRDLKKKLGIEGLKWQMKTMSRYLRKMHDRGLLTYCAASFTDNAFVFKDCVRLDREPSEDDWRYLLATGKKTSANPGNRLRGKRARALHKKRKKKWNGIGRPPKGGFARRRLRKLKKSDRNPPRPDVSAWVPEKPIANTLVDFVKSGGDIGYTGPEITRAIAHPSFAKYMTTLSRQLSVYRVQPPHLSAQKLVAERVRSEKKRLIAYVCTGEEDEAAVEREVEEVKEESVIDPALATSGGDAAQQSAEQQKQPEQFGFAPIQPEHFAQSGTTFTALCDMEPNKLQRRNKRGYNRKPKVKAAPAPVLAPATEQLEPTESGAVEAEKTEETTAAVTTKKAKAKAAPPAVPASRPARKRRAAAKRVSYVDDLRIFDEDDDTGAENGSQPKEPTPVVRSPTPEEEEAEPEAQPEPEPEVEQVRDRSLPGVYWGVSGSLNPNLKRKGRPKKSIVLIFKSEKFKDPNYLPGWADYLAPPPEAAPPPLPAPPPIVHTDVNVQGAEPEPEPVLPSVEKPSLMGFICEKCGGRWEGENGLKYHLEKGKNLCNPYYAARPDKMEKKKWTRQTKRRSSSPEFTDESSEADSFHDGEGDEEEDDGGKAGANRKSSSSVASATASPALPAPDQVEQQQQQQQPEAVKPPSATAAAAPKKAPPKPKKKPSEPAIPRPVLKPRPILKKNKQRTGGGMMVPRGIEASEAAAQESLATKPVEHPHVTFTVPDRQEDENEPLPYLDQIRPKPPPQPVAAAASKPAKGRKALPTTAVDRSGGGTEGSSNNSVYPEPPSTTNDATVSASLPPESAGAEYVGEVRATTARKTVPGYSSVKYINTTPSLRLPTADKDQDLWHEDNAKRGNPRMVYRIQEIVKHLVHTSGGVFPMDRALHWAVLKVYQTTFGEDAHLPTMASCTRVAAELARQGEFSRHSLAFKTHRGSIVWRQLHMIALPHMKPDHPAVNALKVKTKASGTDMYIPPPYNPTESEKVQFRDLEKPRATNARDRGPGRRDHKMVEQIATLDAPYYASKGIMGVRQTPRGRLLYDADDAGDDADEERPMKRRKKDRGPDGAGTELKVRRRYKRKRADGEDGAAPAAKRRGRRPRFLDDDGFIIEPSKLTLDSAAKNPGLLTLPHSFFFGGPAVPSNSSDDYTAPTSIEFLEPNTQLEDDYELELETGDGDDSASSSSDESDQEDQDAEQSLTAPDTFASMTRLRSVKGKKGAWPRLGLTYFEKAAASFTMKGWLPGQNDILMQNMPKTLEQMASKVSSRCKTEQWADADYGDFCGKIDGCRAWELSEQGVRYMSGSIAPAYLFMNISAPVSVSSMAPVHAQWLDANEWTLETIPYEMLEDDGNFDPSVLYEEEKEAAPAPRRRPGRPRRIGDSLTTTATAPKRRYKRVDRDPNLREIKMQRELTAYPAQTSEFFRAKGEERLGVDWKAEDTRIAAYVCVATLTGGINKAMDWGLMMRLFPESKLSNLRKFWCMIKKERDGFINTLTEKFQEEFLEAYESGVLPPFDFDKPLEYDWPRLVKWTLALVVREGITLPRTRKQFDDEIELLMVNQADFDWREMYHHWQRSVFNKLQDTTSEAATTRLDGGSNKKMVTAANDSNEMAIARSWVRALCCTEQDQETPYKIKDKFLTLKRAGDRDEQGVSDLLEATILDLERRRIAIKRKANALSARPYRLNEHFSRQLERLSHETKYTVAAEFKLQLDAAFRRGEAVEMPWRTEDGMVLAAFNLQAHGRVRIEPVKRLDIPFGFQPGFYESRKFPKSYYRFDMHIVPTERYLYNEDIEVLQQVTQTIPGATADGKLPMWCDFFGQPHRARWFKMLGGAMFMSATRGAMTDDYMALALKPCFEPFEIALIREWALGLGLVREIAVAGGPTAPTEWWWLAVGLPLLEMRPAVAPAEDVGPGGDRTGRRTLDQYAAYGSRRRGGYRVL